MDYTQKIRYTLEELFKELKIDYGDNFLAYNDAQRKLEDIVSDELSEITDQADEISDLRFDIDRLEDQINDMENQCNCDCKKCEKAHATN